MYTAFLLICMEQPFTISKAVDIFDPFFVDPHANAAPPLDRTRLLLRLLPGPQDPRLSGFTERPCRRKTKKTCFNHDQPSSQTVVFGRLEAKSFHLKQGSQMEPDSPMFWPDGCKMVSIDSTSYCRLTRTNVGTTRRAQHSKNKNVYKKILKPSEATQHLLDFCMRPVKSKTRLLEPPKPRKFLVVGLSVTILSIVVDWTPPGFHWASLETTELQVPWQTALHCNSWSPRFFSFPCDVVTNMTLTKSLNPCACYENSTLTPPTRTNYAPTTKSDDVTSSRLQPILHHTFGMISTRSEHTPFHQNRHFS